MFTFSDGLLAACTLAGPVFAVQAQKWIERSRETRSRKLRVFEDLMTSRRENLSFQHQRALNMIDFVFRKDTEVLNAWHNLFDHFSMPVTPETIPPGFTEARQKLFNVLLKEMSKVVGLHLEDRSLERGYYSPQAHVDMEAENYKIRKGLIGLLDGTNPMKMAVVSFAVDPDALAAQQEVQRKLSSLIESGTLHVTVDNAPSSASIRTD
ncbi:DUF6680 family protein [Rhodanobacter sp. A1T4]|uniref:DUF6680 family protein n=1 Tax=Rhodanobacter sp. A1T4 TaxID=2723087 RepID=UPI00160F1A8D|nr:DUF6680 family protein [Rhodanobacter sp. A1T4]MBB6246331.1 hypothetical protein [Rhodanobacter sp. A1T4]